MTRPPEMERDSRSSVRASDARTESRASGEGSHPPKRSDPPGAALYLEISATAPERVRADLLAVAVFSDERPLRGAAGRADWRLCGRLSRLVAEGRLSGQPGEAVLAASFGGLAAPLVLVLGVGPRSAFDASGLQAFAGESVRRALALRVPILALPMPDETAEGAGLGEREERLLFGAADALATRPASQPSDLRLVVLVRDDELPRALDLLRTSKPLHLPASVSLRTAEPGERSSPRGRPGSSIPDTSLADSIK